MAHPETDHNERFRTLYDAHVDAVHRYVARRVTSDGNQAVDDLVADVFMVAYRRLDDVATATHPVGWLLAVARRIVANHHRTNGRRRTILGRIHINNITDDPSERVVNDTTVRQALEHLSNKDQELLRLAFWDELSVPEMALVLDTKPATVSVRLHRARNRFAAAFNELTERTPTQSEADETGQQPDDKDETGGPSDAGNETPDRTPRTTDTDVHEHQDTLQETDMQRHEHHAGTHNPTLTIPTIMNDPQAQTRPNAANQTGRGNRADGHDGAAVAAFKAADPAQGTTVHEPWRVRERIIIDATTHRPQRPGRNTWFKPATIMTATGTLAAAVFLVVMTTNTPDGQISQPVVNEPQATTEILQDVTSSAQTSETFGATTQTEMTTPTPHAHSRETTQFTPEEPQSATATQKPPVNETLTTETLTGLPADDAVALAETYGYLVTVNTVATEEETQPQHGTQPAPAETSTDLQSTGTSMQVVTLTIIDGIVVDAKIG